MSNGSLIMVGPLEGWAFAVIDAHACYLGRPKPENPKVFSPVYFATAMPTPTPKGMMINRAVAPVHFLAGVNELDVSGLPTFPASKVGPALLRIFANEVEKAEKMIDMLRTSEYGLEPAIAMPARSKR